MDQPGASVLGSLVRLQSRCHLGLQSLEGSMGLRNNFKMAHSRGYWWEASVPHHMGLSKGLFEHPYNMALASPRASDVRERKQRKHQNAFYDLVSKF